MQPLRVLVGCEESQAVCIAFRKAGHEAYSCDLKPCSGGHPEWHLQGDVFEFLKLNWDLFICHPTCTYLTSTAARWLQDQPERASGALVGEARRQAQKGAIDFVRRLVEASRHIPQTCFENPVGVLSSAWRKPDQIIQPMQFGHKEPKKTCLWLKGLPLLRATHKGIEPEYHITKSGKRVPRWFFYADKSKGQTGRAETRSKTFEGISKAMADQWSNAQPTPQLLFL